MEWAEWTIDRAIILKTKKARATPGPFSRANAWNFCGLWNDQKTKAILSHMAQVWLRLASQKNDPGDEFQGLATRRNAASIRLAVRSTMIGLTNHFLERTCCAPAQVMWVGHCHPGALLVSTGAPRACIPAWINHTELPAVNGFVARPQTPPASSVSPPPKGVTRLENRMGCPFELWRSAAAGGDFASRQPRDICPEVMPSVSAPNATYELASFIV